MLTDCERFRRDWEPGGEAAHAEACPSCRRWARTLGEAIAAVREPAAGSAAAAAGERGLPEALGRALAEVPREGGPCPTPSELVEVALSADRSAHRGHLARCPRCRELAEVLVDGTFRGTPRLPAGLRARLVSIAEPVRRAPSWLRWGDVGSLAASFLLTMALTLVAGDSAASLFREPTLPSAELGWVAEGRQRVRETWIALADDMEAGWGSLRDVARESASRWNGWRETSPFSGLLPTVEIDVTDDPTTAPSDNDHSAALEAADRGERNDD